jgi:ribonuclease BN (tRNA processing enzyme)
MEITFVGSGDAFGSGGRFQTCIRLQHDGYTALVDCGATSLTALKEQGIDPNNVDAVAVSHLHGDHFGGLPFLILDGQFARRTKALTVLGPRGTEARLRAAMENFYPGSTSVQRRFAVEVVELAGDGSRQEAGPLTVSSWEVDHASGAPALALNARIGGDTFGYSGDTAWTSALLAAADNTEVFACEAYTYDKPIPYHLDYATVRQHAAALDTGQLVLTHMGPTVLERLNDITDTAAHDGLSLST